MITILLTCLIVAGGTLTLTPPTGWEVVRITGKAAPATEAAVEIIELPVVTSAVASSAPTLLPGMGDCKLMLDTRTLACPKAPQAAAAQKLPPPAEQVEVTVRRTVLVGDDLQAPKGCELRVESGEGEK